MYDRILVPLDGSAAAEQVLPLTKTIAERFHSSVILFRVIVPLHDGPRAQGDRPDADKQIELSRWMALEYLETLRKDFAGCGIPAQCEVQVGAPAKTILEFVDDARVDLIAMTTHGRTGAQRWAYGRVADRVVHGAGVPLLLLRVNRVHSVPLPITRILVPLDGSARAERALEPARQLADAFNSDLLLLRVWQVPFYCEVPVTVLDEIERQARRVAEGYLGEVMDRAKGWKVRVDAEAHPEPVAERIVELAEERGASLIVICTHGRSGLGRWAMGSVADRVLRASPVPVLLIRSLPKGK